MPISYPGTVVVSPRAAAVKKHAPKGAQEEDAPGRDVGAVILKTAWSIGRRTMQGMMLGSVAGLHQGLHIQALAPSAQRFTAHGPKAALLGPHARDLIWSNLLLGHVAGILWGALAIKMPRTQKLRMQRLFWMGAAALCGGCVGVWMGATAADGVVPRLQALGIVAQGIDVREAMRASFAAGGSALGMVCTLSCLTADPRPA